MSAYSDIMKNQPKSGRQSITTVEPNKPTAKAAPVKKKKGKKK